MNTRRPALWFGLAAICGVCVTATADETHFPTLGGQPLIPIRWSSGCGPNALYLCLDLSGVKVRYADLIAKSGLSSPADPTDLGQLWQLARDCGGHAQAVRVTNGPDVLRKIMQETGVRTAIVHLRAVERDGKKEAEHFSAVMLSKDTLRIVGAESYEHDVAAEWQSRWSGAALLVSAKPIYLAGPPGGPQPQVFLRPSKFDCGRVYAGTKVPYQFTIENRGDADLEILDVRSGCSCSTPAVADRLVHPKQSTLLDGLVDAGPNLGRRSVQITIFANDPERPQVQVDITLDVTPLPVRLSESTVAMNAKTARERPQAVLRVDYEDPNAAIRVARLEPSADWLKAELSPDARQISLSADPLNDTKDRTATLTLYTANPEAALRVPVEVHLITPVECQPAQLYLDRKSAGGDTIRRTITLRPRPDTPFAAPKAEIRGVPGVVKNIRRVPETGVWEVEVEFGPFSEQTAMTVGRVEISDSANSAADKIQVPVYIR
jgi:hypothetical protein